MRKRTIAIVLLLLIATSSALAWAFWPRGPDPHIAKIEELQKQALNLDPNISLDERRKNFELMRQESEKLTPEQRAVQGKSNPFLQELRTVAHQYLTMPENERTAFLDQQIDRMEAFRKLFESMAASQGKDGQPRRPPGPAPDAQKRHDWEKRMLENTNPEDRAAFGLFFAAVKQRRQERGLPSFGPF